MKLSESRTVHFTPDHDAIAAFLAREPGAERAVMERLADATLKGEEINPIVQKVANAIIAQALLQNGLPPKKVGRKFADAFRGHEAAYRFFELTDGGMPQKDALVVVQQEHGFVDRQIRFFVQRHRPIIGRFPEDRERYRAWRESCEAFGMSYEASVRIDLNIAEGLPAVPLKQDPQAKLIAAQQFLEAIRAEDITAINSA